MEEENTCETINTIIGKEEVFLWKPKKISGKWCWLRKVIKKTTTYYIVVNGKMTPLKKRRYILKEDDNE